MGVGGCVGVGVSVCVCVCAYTHTWPKMPAVTTCGFRTMIQRPPCSKSSPSRIVRGSRRLMVHRAALTRRVPACQVGCSS